MSVLGNCNSTFSPSLTTIGTCVISGFLLVLSTSIFHCSTTTLSPSLTRTSSVCSPALVKSKKYLPESSLVRLFLSSCHKYVTG